MQNTPQIRYIHAADLHLDRPIRSIPTNNPQLLNELRELPYLALRRLCTICEAERPDFVVIAGDVYDQEEHGIKSQLALLDFCEKLAPLHIPVFIAHGNHDPLSSQKNSLNWPDNVTIFSEKNFAIPVIKNNNIIAMVHGISHARAPENENLALKFHRIPEMKCFQLGVLHCSLNDERNAEKYAPCDLDDLISSGLDAWALGHVHSKQIISDSPFIAYSGTIQGFHINENDEKGCLSVTAAPVGESWEAKGEFRTLSPLVWKVLPVNMEHVQTIDELKNEVLIQLEQMASDLAPGTSFMALRIVLNGKTALHNTLSLQESQKTLLEAWSSLANNHPAIFIKDLKIETRPYTERDLTDQSDFIAEIFRLKTALEEQPDKLVHLTDTIATPLYHSGLGRKYLKMPDLSTQKDLLSKAFSLCQEYLETK